MHAFLFTDIESSTRLWEEHPTEMSGALERHDEIMRAAITGVDGRLLKTTGDGSIAVFSSAADAIRATVAAQQRLQAEAWGTTPIKVRMGVHAGETQTRDGDHFGPVMNRTARIMAAGHGGQVLVSATAATLASADLTDGTALRDLGTHRLKDLTEPEHLFQVVHPDLPGDFPGLRSLDARPNNLPLQATEFLGRSRELATLHGMLDDPSTRLLTIAGPGGAGKTRLGLQVAADRADSYPDGVWFVDLAADSRPDDAFETVVRALGLPVSRTGSPLSVLKNRLRDRRMLLMLDNFEQVIDAGPSLGELLMSAPGLTVVVTSREKLRVRGEQVYPVPPLSMPDPKRPYTDIAASEAVQLFTQRATAADPSFTLTEDDAPAIAAICVRLDGLPLAIELAAARLNLFTPKDLLKRITERLDVLGSGGRDVPERQRTLWGAIGWSYELLAEEDRALFELFAVFSGAELTALEAVAGDALGTGVVLDALSSLVDKSLVRLVGTAGSSRFAMLQMIKEYAAQQLGKHPERQAAAVTAHAAHYAAFAAEQRTALHGSDRGAGLLRLELDLDNLRSAWHHWVAMADPDRMGQMIESMWELHAERGWYHGAIELASDMLQVLADTEPSSRRDAEELRYRVRHARALMAVHGYNLEVEQAFSRALALTESAADTADQVAVLRALASYHLQMAHMPASGEIGRRLVEIGRSSGDEAVELEGRLVIGNSLLFFDAGPALEHLDDVIRRYDPSRHRAGYQLGPNTGVVARIASALVMWEVGKLDTAVARVQDALEFADRIRHPYSLAWAVFHEGFFATARGRFDDVLDAAGRLATMSDEHDYALWRTLATVLEGLAVTAQGDPGRGVALTEQGVSLYEGLAPPPIFWPYVLGLRAGAHALAGDPSAALGLMSQAMAITEAGGMTPPDLLIRTADLVQAAKGPSDPEAAALYERAARESNALGLRLPELRAQTRLVRLHRTLGSGDDGSEALAAVLAGFTEGHQEADLAAAREVLQG